MTEIGDFSENVHTLFGDQPCNQCAREHLADLLLLCETQPFCSSHPSVQRRRRICPSPGGFHEGVVHPPGSCLSHNFHALSGRAFWSRKSEEKEIQMQMGGTMTQAHVKPSAGQIKLAALTSGWSGWP